MNGITNTSEWITIKQAARITGQSVRTWCWRAQKESTAAMATHRRALAMFYLLKRT